MTEQEQIYRKPVIAVDFDGTLCRSAYPDIGEPNRSLIERLIEMQGAGWLLILWTCREGELLEKAVKWCSEQGLTFDAVNDNVRQLKEMYGNDPRKVGADIYIDDKNVLIDNFSEVLHNESPIQRFCQQAAGRCV